MEVCKGSPDLMSGLQMAHSIELRPTQGSKQKVPRFVVHLVLPMLQLGDMVLKHLEISTLANIPDGRMLALKECRHADLPICVVQAIEPWNLTNRLIHGPLLMDLESVKV